MIYTEKLAEAKLREVYGEVRQIQIMIAQLWCSVPFLRAYDLLIGDDIFEDLQKVGWVQKFNLGSPQTELAWALAALFFALTGRPPSAAGPTTNARKLESFSDNMHALNANEVAVWASELTAPTETPRNAREFSALAQVACVRVLKLVDDESSLHVLKRLETTEEIDIAMQIRSWLLTVLSVLATDN